MTSYNQRQRERGVVMVLTLLAALLLVGLVLWVLNLGGQVNRRVDTQNTADATVQAGSTWVARSMNLVAMNNLTMSRYVALVNVMDALPMAVDFARREQTSMRDALETQLARGVGNGPSSLMSVVQDEMEKMLNELEDEIDQLEPIDDLFDDIDVREMTWYNAPGGRGRLWQAMEALDDVNTATMENLGELAQLTAVNGGQATQHNTDAAAVAMFPLEPVIPFKRGRFHDFQRPVRVGLLPELIDDVEERRGPFDTVFGWHQRVGRLVGSTWVPGSSSGAGGRGDVPLGGGSGGGTGGRRVGGEWEWTHYRTWGWMGYYTNNYNWSDPDNGYRGTITSYVYHHMYHSRLSWWIRQISDTKLKYIWPNRIDQPTGNYDPNATDDLSVIRDPEWVTDFIAAKRIADRDRSLVKETAFFVLEIKSRYPKGHAAFMSAGSWAFVTDHNRHQPRITRRRGWMDPTQWESMSSVTRVGNYGWREEWGYEMFWDHQIGLYPETEDDGTPRSHKIYRYDHFYFAGANIGEEVNITNPYEGFNPNDPDAPSPTQLRHELLTRDPSSRRQYLTYLSVAQQPDNPQAWASAFHSNKPYRRVVAIAQAKVFNNHSWDLWTPMWHAQMEPITRYDVWLNQIESSVSAGSNVPGIDMVEMGQVSEYLNSLGELGPIMLGH